jgi:hypothetical protein
MYLKINNKSELTLQWCEFFKAMQEDHQLLAMTVVFKPIDRINTRERWESEYTAGVLKKIRRALEPNQTNQESAIPFEDFYYFERFAKTGLRTVGRKCPFHIHSLLPIRKAQLRRIWSFDNNNLTERLLKDIKSLQTVQSILVEPIKDQDPIKWIRYITKQKVI